jgi:GDP-L-fucose synthase
MAEACLLLMNEYNEAGHINIGTGQDMEINELAEMLAGIIHFRGKILHDTSLPDGMPRRRLDVSKINKMGWVARTPLREGLQKTIQYIYENKLHETW